MNLQNHKQQEINFNKETNSSSQKQSQVKLGSKSTASSFKNQSSSNSWRKLVLESQKSISQTKPFCDRFFRTNETNFTNRPSQNVLIEKSFLNQNQSLENRQEKREKQTQSKLTSLSDSNLLSQTKLLVQKERKITVEMLEHLCEIDQRKLYLKRGFSSLFDYATKELGYNEGSAYRRINAMKLCREFPETISKIQNGSLNLTTASKLQAFFEKQRKNQSKLRRSDSSPRRNVASILENQSQVDLKDQKQLNLENQNQKKICLDSEMASSCLENQSLETDQEEGENRTQEEQVKQIQENQKLNKLKLLKKIEGKSGRQTEQLLQEIDPTIQKSKRKIRHLNPDQVEVKIVLSKKSYKGMEQLKYLLSHRNLSEGEIFALLINLGLEKYDPKKYKTREDKKTQSKIQSKQTQFATDSTVKKSQVTFDKKTQSKEVELGIEILSKNTYYTQNVSKTLSQNNRNRITPDVRKIKSQYIFEKKEIKERIKNHEELTARNSQNKSLNTNNTHHYKKQTSSQNTQRKTQSTHPIKKISRYISAKTRKQVWLRDEGRCTYSCPQTKRQCHSQNFLQIDHIQPYALGGNHEIKNLRLLCANHNQYRK